MKFSREVVRPLALAAKKHGVGDSMLGLQGERIQSFFLEDFSVSFSLNPETKKPSFYGLSFEVLGKSFTVLSDYEILVTLPSEDGESEESYALDDPDLIEYLERYVAWRGELLERHGV